MSNLLRHWFAEPALLWLSLALPLLALLGAWARRRRRRALALLGAAVAFEAVVARRRGLSLVRGILLLAGLSLLIVGTAGPQWGRDWGQSAAPGRDLVVVLDLSRSMLAENPSRLERAQRALLDLGETVRQRGGHRLGLVVFAGHARLACPLTHDYDHFRETVLSFDLDHLDPTLWPEKEAPSGTRIGEALWLAVEAHDTGTNASTQDILLVSDGDDPADDEEWKKGANFARLRDLPVHTVGVGEVDRMSTIPFDDKVFFHDGKKVQTRLEEKPLQAITRLTGGAYVRMPAGNAALGELFLERMEGAVREDSPDALPVYQQRQEWFLGPAFGLLVLALAVGDGSRRRARRSLPLY